MGPLGRGGERGGRYPHPQVGGHRQQGQQEDEEEGEDAAEHQEGTQEEEEEGQGSPVQLLRASSYS